MRFIFGYGSLIFRPSFEYTTRTPARLYGWSRRFWQGSTDHRGVPGAPGRVVTLVREDGAACDGVAYGIAHDHAPGALAHLDVREQGGYTRHDVELTLTSSPREQARVPALVYVAGPDNPEYLGPAPLDAIARHIASARGPSGANADYAIALAEALRALGADDPHVFAIEALVRALGEARAPR